MVLWETGTLSGSWLLLGHCLALSCEDMRGCPFWMERDICVGSDGNSMGKGVGLLLGRVMGARIIGVDLVLWSVAATAEFWPEGRSRFLPSLITSSLCSPWKSPRELSTLDKSTFFFTQSLFHFQIFGIFLDDLLLLISYLIAFRSKNKLCVMSVLVSCELFHDPAYTVSWWIYHGPLKRMYSAVVGCRSNNVRSSWLIVMFRSSIMMCLVIFTDLLNNNLINFIY